MQGKYYTSRIERRLSDRTRDNFGRYQAELDLDPTYLVVFLEKFGNEPGRCVRCLRGLWHVSWTIHHLNHNHDDNRAENLVVLCRGCHAAEHRTGQKDNDVTKAKRVASFRKTAAQMDKNAWAERSHSAGSCNRGVKKHNQFGSLQSVAQATSRWRVCECGLETNAGAMGRHTRRTGHEIVGRGL